MMRRFASNKVDEQGRVIVPRDLREQLDMKEGDGFVMYYVDKSTAILQVESRLARKPDDQAQMYQGPYGSGLGSFYLL